MAPVRRAGRLTGPEAVAENVPESFTDLRPYLRDGTAGIRSYTAELTRWLETNGSNAAALPGVLRYLGVDLATCFRVALQRSVIREGGPETPDPQVALQRSKQ